MTEYPEKVAKKKPRDETIRVCVAVVDVGGAPHFFLTKRPEKGLLAGLWEFPNVPVAAQEDPTKDAKRGGGGAKAGEKELASLLGDLLRDNGAGDNGDNDDNGDGGLTLVRNPGRKHGVDLQHIGGFTHVFSHIKQKSVVDTATVEAALGRHGGGKRNGDGGGATCIIEGRNGEVRWKLVPCDSEEGIKALSTGVRKAVALYQKHLREKKTHIGNFFAKKKQGAKDQKPAVGLKLK